MGNEKKSRNKSKTKTNRKPARHTSVAEVSLSMVRSLNATSVYAK